MLKSANLYKNITIFIKIKKFKALKLLKLVINIKLKCY